MYGIGKGIAGDFAIGGVLGFVMLVLSKLLPAFSLAVPYIVGLSVSGQWIVIVFLAPIIEEIFFRGAMLGFLTEKTTDPARIDGFRRVIMLVIISFFLIGWIVTNYMFQTGMIFAVLAGMSLLVYALWDKIPHLNYQFHVANIITAIVFAAYHVIAYAKEISISAIMNVSSAFVTAILVGLLAGYLTRWRQSLTPAIALHMCLNALIFITFWIVV